MIDEELTGLSNEADEEEIFENPTRYLMLPTKFEINEYHIMEEFIWSLDEDNKANQLAYSIQGRAAFRSFKNKLHELRIDQHWYDFRDDYYKNLAIEWCEGHHLQYKE